MNDFEITRQVLARTRNRAVLPLLSAALKSSSSDVRAAAIRAAVQRVDLETHTQLIGHFAAFDDSERETLAHAHRAVPHHATPALKAALRGSNEKLRENACSFLVYCQHFEAVPLLLSALENPQQPNPRQLADTVLQLVRALADTLNRWAVASDRTGHDPSFTRHQVLAALERLISANVRSVRPEILSAFVLLAPSDHPLLLRILNDERHVCHAATLLEFSSNDTPLVFERLTALLRDTEAPDAALKVIAHRTDRAFVQHLLRSIRYPVPLRALHNMKRMESVAWLQSHREMLLDLDGRAQAVAVELAAESAIAQESLFDLLMMFLRDGLAEGRRAACQALNHFAHPSADMLVLAALDDPDAAVQAAAVRQLRPRRVPESLKVLVKLLDSNSLEVREAAKSSLAEFNFVRYRAMFDLLDESAIKATGVLVRKVDQSAVDGLLEELTSPSVTSRLRGIEMAVAMQATQDVCPQLVELAKHENAAVRKEAIAALAGCSGPQVIDVLQQAAGDSNYGIAQTAEQSLAQIRRAASPDSPIVTI